MSADEVYDLDTWEYDDPPKCPECGCDMETEEHASDCGYEDEDD